MLLFALDTAGQQGSLALAEATGADAEICLLEQVLLAGRNYSEEIIPQLASLLDRHLLSKSDLAAFAVVTGPGSFTGVRAGLATVMALAEVWGLPIAPVSLLELIAAIHVASSGEEAVVVVADAGRGELFTARYERLAESKSEAIPRLRRCGEEALLKFEEFIAIHTPANYCILTPDESVAIRIQAVGLLAQVTLRPTAADVAVHGYQKLLRGEGISAAELEANYVRRSDAELFARPGPQS